MGVDPRSPANRGWGWGWTPDPRRIGDEGGDGPPIVGVCRAAALNGDLITLTVRVAGATVVSGVIGHCRLSQINKLDWLYN